MPVIPPWIIYVTGIQGEVTGIWGGPGTRKFPWSYLKENWQSIVGFPSIMEQSHWPGPQLNGLPLFKKPEPKAEKKSGQQMGKMQKLSKIQK